MGVARREVRQRLVEGRTLDETLIQADQLVRGQKIPATEGHKKKSDRLEYFCQSVGI